MWRQVSNAGYRFAQLLQAGAGRCDDRADRHSTELLPELLYVDADATLIRRVRHGERDDRGEAKLKQLLHQEQSLVEIRRIEHRENSVRLLRALHAPENHIDRDVFFERVCAQRVCAGQIDQLYCLVVNFQDADMLLDGNARIVADLLLETGQAIEQRTLAGVRIAHNRDAGG